MKCNLTSAIRRGGRAGLILLLAFTAVSARAGTPKFEFQLIWGTNDPESPDSKHKPVDRETRKKLDELPLKWANYFEVCRKCPAIAAGAFMKVKLSEQCEIGVQNLGDSKVEVLLFGKGEAICKRTQTLSKGEILVLGGNAPNQTAWLVTMKRVD
jgi:hypothetical protein